MTFQDQTHLPGLEMFWKIKEKTQLFKRHGNTVVTKCTPMDTIN